MKKNICIISIFVLVSVGLLLGSTLAVASESGDLPIRPPTATPVPIIAGGRITLSVQATQPMHNTLWTVVQWQDANQDWHDVEGWQGTLDENGQVIWWVAAKDLETGPFRWLVYESTDKQVSLVTSESFNLPHNKQTIVVDVTLP